MRRVFSFALLILCASAMAEELKMEDLIPKEFDRYHFVMLVRGAGTHPAGQAENAQMRHLAYLRDLNRTGDLLTYGPFEAGPDEARRGIAIFRGDLSVERVRELLDEDPHVQAGVLRYEILTWMTAKGQIKAGAASK